MTPISALAEQLRQCREALEAMLHVPALLEGARSERHRDLEASILNEAAMAMDESRAALSAPAPTQEQIAELARHAEIGRLVEAMPIESSLNKGPLWWSFNNPGGQYAWKRDTPLDALRAALGGET